MLDLHDICSKFFENDTNAVSSVIMSFQQNLSKSNGGSHMGTKGVNKTQFINFILNSGQFISHFERVFGNVIHSIFFDESDVLMGVDDCKNVFIKTVVRTKHTLNNKDVQDFIKQTNLFELYYTDMINSVYSFYYNQRISERHSFDILELLKKTDFMEKNKHDIETIIHNQIRNIEPHSNVKQMDMNDREVLSETNKRFISLYENKFGSPPTIHDIKEFQTFMDRKENIADMYFTQKYMDYTFFSKKIIDDFFSVFKRDITVFEYVKYFKSFTSTTRDDTDFIDNDKDDVVYNAIKNYYDNYKIKYNKVFNMYNAFLNHRIDTQEFVKTYLPLMDIDDDEYENIVKEMIVKYPEYKKVVTDKIQNIYLSTFTKTISDTDLAFFFKKIHQMRLSLQDERFTQVVTTLKEETDNYHAKIHSITHAVLNRNADEVEIETFIVYFRNHETSQMKPEIQLENELYESLEYHDVLKDIIVQEFGKRLKKTLSRSELFKMLQHILSLDDKYVKRDREKVFAELCGPC